jgi:hypothetical protein
MIEKEHTPLAQELTAQVQLGLMGTVGKLSRQLRAIDRIAPQLKDGGVVRKVTVDRDRKRRSVGVAEASRSLQAFGGVLYSVAAVAHEMFTAGSDMSHDGQNSRMDVGDMSLLEFEKRVDWKTFLAVYDLLGEIFESDSLPDLILLDTPLILGRRVFAQVLDSGDEQKLDLPLKKEIEALQQKINGFWDRHRQRCFPYAENGPKIVSLHRGRLREPLSALQGRGGMVTPDRIDAEVLNLMRTEWAQVLSVGIERLLLGILGADQRTAAFQREQAKDKDAFPKSLIEGGTLTFHYLTGMRGQPVHVETLGSAQDWTERGGSGALDALAGDLMALTYFDHKKALPLPLWHAQNAVQVVKRKGILEFYKRETLRAMQEEQVDQAWMTGWEEE